VELILPLVAVMGYLVYRLFRLGQQNRKLAARVVEVDQMKRDFISHASHELKAPLASMQETTHLLLEGIPGSLTEKQERLLELNLQSGKRLARMIGNMLDLSRLQAGTVEYDMQEQDIAELVRGVVVELSVQASEKALRVLTDIPPEPIVVQCDPNRMVQLFTNLLENALRFSVRGGTVSVHVSSARQLTKRISRTPRRARPAPCGFALIAIADSGPGIDDEYKEAVFHAFHQPPHGKKSPGQSLGLGLAIARAVVEAHRGTIWVEDNPSGGSVFCVALPRSAAQKELRKAS
jgi:two-component system sensor histidine kinase GlrK